ncbi:transposase [Brevibacillus aydinogluensis]|uniref:IS21 family transposase n=2 Tax=Brevibacillus TaxID=55080 RepID=A0AA48M4Q0_9BACL|nr:MULTISPECIES: IS21 family transposase [Bacillales]MBR8661813.1 IS21 family transposase [Brevibacillus sp. NL20B1]MBS2773208.1 IS21 family transposase [Anoxybacillus rupiensis]MDT3418259.1 transposase [Brevibacillus aydinogluensis]CAJ1001071.1 IS21 family transposase [Brevibacillus aydinogluensis]CAJ1001230.1 IS21 family transposase [Brevibacillus aydinogluensis]
MLAMAYVQFIKHLREKEALSINQIAKKLGIHWRTAKKYADCDDWNQPMKSVSRRYRVLEPYLDIVDAWLLEDGTRPRKQRHTAKRIYDRLVAEHGFTGSDRTVRYYVAKRRKELRQQDKMAYLRLEHPGGEAQVDFGTVQVILNGREQTMKQLTISFPYSNAAFAMLLPAENTECFLEGLRRIFERIGGVPTRLWFDNLSAAVVSVGPEGQRHLTDTFERFVLHYRFEPVFCNPASGHEKGHVENKVGYTRRNWCVPTPSGSSLEELQIQLDQRAEQDLNRLHYAKGESIRKLWEHDQRKLLQLPMMPFEAVRLGPARVNNYGEIKLDGTPIPLTGTQPGQTVLLKIRWDTVDVLDAQQRVITTIARPYMQQGQPIDWVTVLRAFQAKPRALPYASLFGNLPMAIQKWLTSAETVDEKRRRLSWLIRQLKSGATLEQLDHVLAVPTPDWTVMEHRLYRMQHPDRSFEVITDPYTPTVLLQQEPDISRYDQLKRAVMTP